MNHKEIKIETKISEPTKVITTKIEIIKEEMDNIMGRTGPSKTKVTLATLPMVPRALGVDDHGTINHLDSALTPRGKIFQELNGYILALNITRKESGNSPPPISRPKCEIKDGEGEAEVPDHMG